MRTTIDAFHQDAEGDWVAVLGCGHSQHMRHRPPWTLREWVTTAEGRASKLGADLDCVTCDSLVMPAGALPYKRTPTFSEQTLPASLRADHRTKPGTWARIVVEQGTVEYHVRGRMHLLTPGVVGLVEPDLSHHVSPQGAVRLFVEFWREPGAMGSVPPPT